MSAAPPAPPRSRGARRLPRLLALAALTVVLVDQGLQWTVLRDGRFLSQRVIPFDPPLFSELQDRLLREYEEDLADPARFERTSMFDADLGWCPRPETRRAGRTYDRVGARIGHAALPLERPSGARLVALVGCSFTEGHEVEAHESWAALVEASDADLLVANLGVGGYGVDQALLRARRDALPLEPDEVWLGFYPGGVLRTTTHFPPIQYKWRARGVLFKPRFVLDTRGEPELVPSPARTPGDVPRLIRSQRDLFDAIADTDLWVRRAPAAYAPRGASWVHRSALARLGVTWYEHRGRDAAAWLRDETSEVHRLHRAMILALRADVEAAGARFRVLILPASPDLARRAAEGGGYWDSLRVELVGAGVEVLDTSPALAAAGGAEEPGLWMPGGHYSPRANELVAETVAERWLGEE